MKLFIKTFGCQMNVHDSSRLTGLLGQKGFSATDDPHAADVIIINTCTVREKAWHKAISETGRYCTLKRHRPDLVIVFAGCVAQQEGERLKATLPKVDLVVSPDHYGELPNLIDAALFRKESHVATGFDDGAKDGFLPTYPGENTTSSAFVTIMKGCSHKCTYCIVPSVRGPERCREAEEILDEARMLVEGGAKELVLLGQKVNGYKKNGVTFPELLVRLNDIVGLERLRFTSPHPRHMTDALIACFASLDTLCESIHLPVQSGSDRVLKAMKRHYTSDFIREIAEKLRHRIPDFHISTDLIVGFPGETESDFQETLRLYEDVRFCGAFSFKYSPRPGTDAAMHMTDDVDGAAKSDRLNRLHEVIDRIEGETRASLVGKRLEVLVEGPARMPGQLTGRARNNQIVNFEAPKSVILETWRSTLVEVDIARALPHSLEGRMINEETS